MIKLKDLIKELLLIEADEKALDDKEKEKAKKLGLVWKGKGYGKKSEDGITHKNVGGKLVKVDKDGEDTSSGQKLSGSDFERDDDPTGGDPDDAWDDEEGRAKPKGKTDADTEDEPEQAGLGGGWDQHDGPDSPDDAVGSDPEKESVIVQGIRQMADKNRGKPPKDQETSVEVDGEKTTNLCDVTVPGTNLFCADNKGIPRAEMPQLKSKPWAKGEKEPWVLNKETGEWEPTKFEETDEEYEQRVPASKLPGAPDEVNTEDLFEAKLEELGIDMSEPQPMNVSDLKATQNELKPANVAFMVDVLMTATPPPHDSEEERKKWELSEKLREPIIVSKDGYILDGHHRWAALVALDIANGGSGDIEMMVKVVEADAEELVEKTKEFTRDQGLQTKPAEKKKEEVVHPFTELYYRMKNK